VLRSGGDPLYARHGQIPPGTLPIVMDNVVCTGNEMSLLDCSHTTIHNCVHSEDFGAICYGLGKNTTRHISLSVIQSFE
jgi:hypothetical protein